MFQRRAKPCTPAAPSTRPSAIYSTPSISTAVPSCCMHATFFPAVCLPGSWGGGSGRACMDAYSPDHHRPGSCNFSPPTPLLQLSNAALLPSCLRLCECDSTACAHTYWIIIHALATCSARRRVTDLTAVSSAWHRRTTGVAGLQCVYSTCIEAGRVCDRCRTTEDRSSRLVQEARQAGLWDSSHKHQMALPL
jgi:hypothetical protein